MLESSINGTLVTLRQDGRPIALPVWFVVLDHKIYIRTRGKKLTRLRNDERCSFLVEAGERWAELRAVHLECDGRVIEPSATLADRIAAAMEQKYAAYRSAGEAMPTATREYYREAVGGLVELEPVGKLLNWDNRRLGVS
jgi:hypothetical protein